MQTHLAIIGPTCVGKTQYTRRLLQTYPLEAVNMDSFQVYSHFSVGTGRADLEALRAHLYGFLDPKSQLTPEAYCTLVARVLAEIDTRGTFPLFEGGSISYLKALLRRYKFRLIGIRPPNDAWMLQAIEERMTSGAELKLLGEIKRGLRTGLRDTAVLRDDVVYLPYVDYVEGRISVEQTRERVRRNVMARQRTQMGEYARLDVEWFYPTPDLMSNLQNIVESTYGLRRR